VPLRESEVPKSKKFCKKAKAGGKFESLLLGAAIIWITIQRWTAF
jgi:hypothetical protein